VKYAKKFLNPIQKISPKNSLSLPRNRLITEMVSLSYDVNDHVYSKSKSTLTSYGFSHYWSYSDFGIS